MRRRSVIWQRYFFFNRLFGPVVFNKRRLVALYSHPMSFAFTQKLQRIFFALIQLVILRRTAAIEYENVQVTLPKCTAKLYHQADEISKRKYRE